MKKFYNLGAWSYCSLIDLFQREFNDLLTKLQEKIQQVSLELCNDSFLLE